MDGGRKNHGLTVVSLADSPGSSIFDLPVQSKNTTIFLSNLPPSEKIRGQNAANDLDTAAGEASFLVFSGGTGCNAICSAFSNACYVMPVSDDGGSSSEIIRVLGGPSVGDIRSRLVRLIPSAPLSSPLDAIRCLLAYRLPSQVSERDARDEWRDIVEGRSSMWKGVPNDRKETIRGFLVYFESELLKRAHKNFNFRNGSIGNYFLAAAQGFFRSLPSAIFLFSSITNSQATILPAIVTNHTVTIAAELEDGQKLVGQCEISHPVAQVEPTFFVDDLDAPISPVDGLGELISPRQNIMFEPHSKGKYERLPARISRLYYINGYGMEIHPSPNADVLANLASRDVLVYSCGSLWTSIIPCLALRGVAGAIARSSSLRAKVLLLNVENDRETDGYTAVDYIQFVQSSSPNSPILIGLMHTRAIVRTLNSNYSMQAYGLGGANTTYPVSAFITDLIYLKNTRVSVDVERITASVLFS
ncbi:hypothetical protein B0H34DRAFT_646295 [Crassisporium funariophilum]|nr:hypothetical protein B0H34DRAFT_646295 [Crassisporium funariophilum]